ncbi:MAG: serine/threonine protein kinase [Candidatus Riflebacteria bacterium]|nr:serine/threonine protein kinase [Candidatus Riflebacteria bacterium]
MGRYRPVGCLGMGAVGVVYRAIELDSGRAVAIKFLMGHHLSSTVQVARFVREVDVLRRLAHPNIVPILDVGRHLDRFLFYVMPFIDGPDLHHRIQTRGRLAPGSCAAILRQMLSALECVHAAGLVHRDVKPGNTIVDESDRVTLMDFGLVQDPARTRLTADGKWVGTPLYVPPEAITSQQFEPRSDLFSLGATVYEALTGRAPFAGTSLAEVLSVSWSWFSM